MPQLNAFAISGLLIAITFLPIFIVLLLKTNNKTAKIYSLHILTVILWGIGSFLIGITDNESLALVIWKYTYISVVYIPVFYLHSMRLLINNPKKKLIIFGYIQAIFFTYISFSNQMHVGTYKLHNSFYYHIGSIYFLFSFIIWMFLVYKTHMELLTYYKKNAVKPLVLFVLGGLGFISGILNFLPGFRIEIYPYGNFFILIHILSSAYAIFRHHLFEIDLTYKKSFVYSILFGTLMLLYLGIVLVLEKLLQNLWGYSSPLVSLVTAFIIGLIFIPLHNFIQQRIDKLFLHSSHISILDENELLRREVAQTEKLKSIATLASGMAHEIKNPLTALKTFTEFLPKKIHDKEFIQKFVPLATKEINRINELVHDLLDYAKPSPPKLTPTNLHELINDTLDILNNELLRKSITVTKDYDLQHARDIAIDDKQIKQVLLNIFINAIDAVYTNGRINITTVYKDDHMEIIIEDTGCGITQEDLPFIFDPFFSKKEDGNGLGLSISYGIIKEHHGSISAESSPGQGTRFRIKLPDFKDFKETDLKS